MKHVTCKGEYHVRTRAVVTNAECHAATNDRSFFACRKAQRKLKIKSVLDAEAVCAPALQSRRLFTNTNRLSTKNKSSESGAVGASRD